MHQEDYPLTPKISPLLPGSLYRHRCDVAAQTHILDGDATGGGHRAGSSRPGKTSFPVGWIDEQIIAHIEAVANDPASSRRVQGNGRIAIDGTRQGVEIRVIVEPLPINAGRIITGFPL
jgi:hypothetical protein